MNCDRGAAALAVRTCVL